MNYYGPREIKPEGSGLWHYTVRNGDLIRPTGYCADGCTGHATPDDACEHYKQYLLDFALHLDGRYLDVLHRCQACGAWTDGYAIVVHHRHFSLCDEHRTRAEVERLLEVGESISSW